MNASEVTILNHRLDPAESELWVTAPVPLTGRFLGPTCQFASTVEVAHYLRPMTAGTGPNNSSRVILPEPAFWDPESPFLYTGILQEAGSTEVVRVHHGLRSFGLSAGGLHVNRRPFRVNGVRRSSLADAAELRQAGINTILCPVTPASIHVWEEADRWGFFVLGSIEDAASAALAETLKGHASCLGWLLTGVEGSERLRINRREPLLGFHIEGKVPEVLPDWAQFLAGRGDMLGTEARLSWIALDGSTSAPLGAITSSYS